MQSSSYNYLSYTVYSRRFNVQNTLGKIYDYLVGV